MRRRLESVLPLLVLVGFVVAALVVNLLLTSAEERGVDALEKSLKGEVEAVARSQNQRFANTFAGTAGISGTDPTDPYRLVENSPEDLAKLEELVELLPPTFRSGFYLVDAAGTVTQGVRFVGDPIGDRFEWPGFDELVASPAFAAGGGVLPVSQGLTTNEPVIALAIPIYDLTSATPAVRGAFVFESVVAEDSDFNKEIGELKRGETGRYYFVDDRGSVVASNESAAIAEMLDDVRFLDEPAGLHRFGGEVVVLAEVPAAGWRVVFRQDAGEFEEALSGPLETVGQILVFGLLAAGFILTTMLFRRLRAARAEQERLRALTEAQQEFISIVSHELRTPVAGILGFLETSLDHWDGMDDDERRAALSRAASNARRLQAMTRDVLDTQSVEAGALVHVLERLNLAAEVRVAVAAARDLDGERTIDLALPDEPIWVDGDADRLQQVLANLIDNARKNSPAVEPLTVTVTRTPEGGEVAVTDHGPGITDESLERIFDKFVRGRGDSVSGTGLGLYISRQIVSAHGGRIWAESAPGEGATFRFVLPGAAGGALEPTSGQPADPAQSPTTS
ncbi:MAG: ATP-binding protein [Actinomycetota bacterium]